MDFLKLIQSLDELLYEVMSWLIFYPVTLWRSFRRPLRMMSYAGSELADEADQQYSDTLSPPLFLLLTLALVHLAELGIAGQDHLVTSRLGLSALIDDDGNLILLRVLIYSLFPLVMATRMVRQQGLPLDRNTMRAPFYSQCYVVAPFALLLGAGGLMGQIKIAPAPYIALAFTIGACLWFGLVQALWFARTLHTSFARGLWHASIAMVESLLAVALAFLPFR